MYGYFVDQLMDIWVISTFWLLWIILLWTFIHKFLCRHMFSLLLGTYQGVELLDHVITLCLIFWGTTKLFSTTAALFYDSTSKVYEGSSLSTSSPELVIVCISIIAILVGVKCFHIVVSICIFLVASVSFSWVIGLFREMSVQILCPSLNWFICLYCWILRTLCIFWIQYLIR